MKKSTKTKAPKKKAAATKKASGLFRPNAKAKGKQLHINLEPEDRAKLERLSTARKMTASDLVRDMIRSAK